MTTAASTTSIKNKWRLEAHLSSGLFQKHHCDMPVPAEAQNAFLNTRTLRSAGCQKPSVNERAVVQLPSDGVLSLWECWLWKFGAGSHKKEEADSFPSSGVIVQLIHLFIPLSFRHLLNAHFVYVCD